MAFIDFSGIKEGGLAGLYLYDENCKLRALIILLVRMVKCMDELYFERKKNKIIDWKRLNGKVLVANILGKQLSWFCNILNDQQI